MSKKIVDIQTEFNEESTSINSNIGSGELNVLQGVSFPSINPESYTYTVYNSGYETDEVDVTKYNYNGVTYNTEIEAKAVRNRDIQSKIDIIDGKIAKCNAHRDKLETISTECNESINNLEKDKQEVMKQISNLSEIESLIGTAKATYNQAKNGVQCCFKCSPFGINIETTNAINYIQQEECSSQSNGLNDVTTKLDKYIQEGNDIVNLTNDYKSKLNEKISALNSQKSNLESQKSY